MSNNHNHQQSKYLPKLKALVNQPNSWNAFKEHLDVLLEAQHRTMEQATDPVDIYKAQGAVQMIKYLKGLRDQVNLSLESKK